MANGSIGSQQMGVINAAGRLQAAAIHDFSDVYGTAATEATSSVTAVLDALVELLGAQAVSDLVDGYVIPVGP